MRPERFAEEKARDALRFEPLPVSPWIKIGEKAIYIQTNYSEPLSRLLKSIPGAVWDRDRRRWQYPFTSGEAIRGATPEINRLADAARQSADVETQRREEARQEREAAKRARTFIDKPRSLRPEYQNVAPGRPRFALVLEAIADDLDSAMRHAPFGLGAGWGSRHWVGQIMGRDGRGRWVRAYLAGSKDYSRANSRGSRGVMVTYLLEEGPVYEISSPTSWRATDRYFARVVDGKLVRMTAAEVTECLAR